MASAVDGMFNGLVGAPARKVVDVSLGKDGLTVQPKDFSPERETVMRMLHA